MEKIRIGIICPSEIAFRRFLPSLQQEEAFVYTGVAIADKSEWDGEVDDSVIKNEEAKAQSFVDTYGGKIFHGYMNMICSDEIDVVYLPLPPALHMRWAKAALENGKHVFVEKPSTTSYQDTKVLVDLAQSKGLAVHENYMFQYHSQLSQIKEQLENGAVGTIHSYHARFGFPMRQANDFRYNKALGGGALLDAGGYVIKLATKMLGPSVQMISCVMKDYSQFNVDMYGSYMFKNDRNEVFIGEYGMDCEYQCSLSVWGSSGILSTDRIFTAPDQLQPIVKVLHNNEVSETLLNEDSHFRKSIQVLAKAIHEDQTRKQIYEEILLQAKLVDEACSLAGR